LIKNLSSDFGVAYGLEEGGSSLLIGHLNNEPHNVQAFPSVISYEKRMWAYTLGKT